MLPAKVTAALRKLLRERAQRLLRALDLSDKMPGAALAENAWLVAEAGRLLDPTGYAAIEIVRADRDARRQFRVCAWDGECCEDATTDDGLCEAHAKQQAREEAEIEAQIERGEIASEEAG